MTPGKRKGKSKGKQLAPKKAGQPPKHAPVSLSLPSDEKDGGDQLSIFTQLEALPGCLPSDSESSGGHRMWIALQKHFQDETSSAIYLFLLSGLKCRWVQ